MLLSLSFHSVVLNGVLSLSPSDIALLHAGTAVVFDVLMSTEAFIVGVAKLSVCEQCQDPQQMSDSVPKT